MTEVDSASPVSVFDASTKDSSVPSVDGWLPIETAPTADAKKPRKPGPQILVFDGVSVGIVAQEIINKDTSIRWWRYQAGPNPAPFGDYDPSPICENPTHWQPLPGLTTEHRPASQVEASNTDAITNNNPSAEQESPHMSEMVERVSAAMHRHTEGFEFRSAGVPRWLIFDRLEQKTLPDEIFDNRGARDVRIIELNARAAIAALREPTEAMMVAAAQTPGMRAVDDIVITSALRAGTDPLGTHNSPNTPLQQAWRAAIDAALSE